MSDEKKTKDLENGTQPSDGQEAIREESIYRRIENMVPEILKKGVLSGMGAILMTEEGIRNVVSEARLPKDVVKNLVAQADSTKKELLRIAGQEFRQFLEHVNLSTEIIKVLTGVRLQINADISFSAKEGGGVVPKIEKIKKVFGTAGDDHQEASEMETPSEDRGTDKGKHQDKNE